MAPWEAPSKDQQTNVYSGGYGQSQITSIADLQWAILENDGKISCIPRKD
jgi:hypothetical protein